ncbi:MAG: DNRLRE domain-containing protein [Bacteroidales bacterium]|nr:DNRLRE domain-containing protein [Bacteroidales bacterium]
MKTLFRSTQLFLIIASLFFISSCEQNGSGTQIKGTAEFSIDIDEEINQLKSGDEDSTTLTSYHLLVSIEDMDGNPVLSDELIPVYIFGSGFISENVELATGDYRLSKFMVIDPSGNVKYASPLEGSALAYLVNDPLPINFSILADQVTNVQPEVLPVGIYPPEEFGYVNFGIQVIKPLHFYTVCILDNPMIMAPTRFTEADLTIYGPDNWHYTFKLQTRINHLIIRGGADMYYFVLKKEGYPVQKMRFTARQLMATSPNNPLILKIPWYSNFHKLVLQPGPEEGKDAMISNLEPDKNFGDHKYFEATFLSESPLTVMRSNRSLISFDRNSIPKSATVRYVSLRLFYDLPVPWDTIVYSTGPTPINEGILWYGAVLQNIIEPWEEDKVTWNNQPESITNSQVYISPFIRNVNFIDLNVTGLFFQSSASSSIQDFEMLFKLYPTEIFPGFRFVSSDYEIEYMRPSLTIYYSLPY